MFRTTLAAAALALAAIAAPGLAQADCKLLQIAEFHTDPNSREPIVDGEINGKPVKVLIETGSADSMIPRSEANRLGLIQTELTGRHYYGVGGETQAYETKLRELKIGQFATSNLELRVSGDAFVRSDVSLILGDDYFSQVDTEFDLAHNAIRLFQAKDCTPPQLVYWGSAYSQADIVPWERDNPAIQSPALLNGKRVVVSLDTGAFSTIVDAALADSVGVRAPPTGTADAPSVHGLGASQDSHIGFFDSFALGDERVNNVRLLVMQLTRDFSYTETGSITPRHLLSGPTLLVGADFFRAHRIFVDVKDRLILFSYAGGTIFAQDQPPEK